MHIQWPGLFFVAWGAFALFSSILHPTAFRWNFRSGMIETILGQTGARIFFAIMGACIIAFGGIVFVGAIGPSKEPKRAAEAPPSKAVQTIATAERYVSRHYGFSIAFPVGWEIEEKSDSHVAASKPNSAEDETFGPNIQLMVVDKPNNPDFIARDIKELPKLMEDYREIGRGTKRVGTLELSWVEFNFTEYCGALRSLNHIVIIGDHVITMAGMCPEDQAASMREVFVACAESLRWSGEKSTSIQSQ